MFDRVIKKIKNFNIKIFVYNLIDDIRERFITAETIAGLYIVGSCIAIYLDEALIKFCIVFGLFGYGVYLIVINRAKQRRLRKQREQERNGQ